MEGDNYAYQPEVLFYMGTRNSDSLAETSHPTVVQDVQNGDVIHLVVRGKGMPKLNFRKKPIVQQPMRTIAHLEGLR